jgi:hypothetical protein
MAACCLVSAVALSYLDGGRVVSSLYLVSEGGCVMSCLGGWLFFVMSLCYVLSRWVAASCLISVVALSCLYGCRVVSSLCIASWVAAALIHLGGLLRLYLVSVGCSCIVSLLRPLVVSDGGYGFGSV